MAENASDRSPDDPLDPDKEARMLLNPPNESVQFSQNATSTNGQVVLPVNSQKSGVGMSKQELMKYANDPFWVRLRLFLFILFWVVWVAMLVGAVVIIMFAPGCPATASLPWWKKSSLVQISAKPEGNTLAEKVSSASANLKSLQDNLDTFKAANIDGILLNGLDPFLLDTSNNATKDEAEKFRNALNDLVKAVHDEKINGKVLVGLTLSETPITHEWFKESQRNGTSFNGYYLWKDTSVPNISISWDYSPDRYKFYGRKSANHAVLNYGNDEMRDKMRSLVLDWVRTKIDGVQADGDLWEEDSNGRVIISPNANLHAHKWIKSGGQNKALIVADSQLTAQPAKEGEESPNKSELIPESALWKDLQKAGDLNAALKKIFARYLQEESPEQNATTPKETKEDAGKGWRSFTLPYPSSESNQIAQKQGLPIAEGVLTALYLLPKSTPILQLDGGVAEQLNKLKSDKLLQTLDKLRKEQSESVLLGRTQLPEVVGGSQVFALSRAYKDKNAYLLLINLAQTSQEVEVKGTFPDLATHSAKIVLTDSKSPADLIGKDVMLSKLKLDPKQVLLVEFSAKE